jgi:hypothetical protein
MSAFTGLSNATDHREAYLNAGDVIRAHTDGGTAPTESNLTKFRIIKIR